MSRRFHSADWFRVVAGLIGADDDQDIAAKLGGVLEAAVDHDATCLLAFHQNAPPDVLHHTMSRRRARHYLDRYLAGPYLLVIGVIVWLVRRLTRRSDKE